MPRYVSILGEFVPAKERVVLRNNSGEKMINPSAEYSKYHGEEVEPGNEFIYEGPDRRALFELWEQGVEKMGQDFRHSPDFLEHLRKFQFKSEKDYFKFLGVDIEKEREKAEKLAAQITSHELPQKVAEIKKLGGGRDTSGSGNDRFGGFGTPKEIG